MEETGLKGELKKLVGIYSKYEDHYPNGDEAQTLIFFFELPNKGGEFSPANEETLELKYFSLDSMPSLINKQHNDFMEDLKTGIETAPIIR